MAGSVRAMAEAARTVRRDHRHPFPLTGDLPQKMSLNISCRSLRVRGDMNAADGEPLDRDEDPFECVCDIETLRNASHFLPLDGADALRQLIVRSAAN